LGEGKPDMADPDWNEEEKVFEAYHVSSHTAKALEAQVSACHFNIQNP